MTKESNPQSQIDYIQQEVNTLHINHIKALLWKEVVENSLKDQRLICEEIFIEVETDTREIFKLLKNNGDCPGIFQDAIAEFRQEYKEMLKNET